MSLLALLAFAGACGPSPRPVPPSLELGWPTPLGNERRAGFENEIVPDSLRLVWDHNAGSGMRTGVLVTDSAVFVGTTNRQLLAFGTRTGRKFWDQRLEGEIPGDIVRAGRTLFMATAEWNGRVQARDMARGRARWKHSVGANRFGPVLDASALYIGNERGQVFALAIADGRELWQAKLSGGVAAVPVSHGDALIVVTARDTVYRIAKADGHLLARAPIDRTISATPALSGDTLVIAQFSGVVTALNATTLQPLWRVDTGAAVTAAPVMSADGTVHVLNRNAEIWRITSGRGLRVVSLGGAVGSSFTLARNRYIVGKLDGTLQVTDMAGHVVAEHKFRDSISGPVAVHDRALYVPFARGGVAKLQ